MTPDDLRALAARLQAAADDPMWADHAEVPKLWLSKAAAALLALADARPVAWRVRQGPRWAYIEAAERPQWRDVSPHMQPECEPLYAAPRPEPRITDEQLDGLATMERKLKERAQARNERASELGLEVTQPEPRRIPDQRLREIVAAAPAGDDWEAALWIAREVEREIGAQPRRPLTKVQITELAEQCGYDGAVATVRLAFLGFNLDDFARAVERAHGITGDEA